MIQQAIKKKGTGGSPDSTFRSRMAVSDVTISKKLTENDIIQSMSRKGNCLDNSVI